MAIILHIDTAVATASVCLSENDDELAFRINPVQKEHSSWLHPAISEVFASTARKATDVDAIAVTIGPGSYTGLRVGLSAAKGLCFSLNKPLITVGTLELMARKVVPVRADLICPVIDARRMEVFTATYTNEMKLLTPPRALILEAGSFDDPQNPTIHFVGDAIRKMQSMYQGSRYHFSEQMPDARDLAGVSQQMFADERFSDLAYTQPMYVKEFYQPAR